MFNLWQRVSGVAGWLWVSSTFFLFKTDFPLLKLILPRKRWFGNNFDPDFLKDRIHGLQCFVNSILEHQDLCTSPSVQDFFCLNEPPACAESLEESHVSRFSVITKAANFIVRYLFNPISLLYRGWWAHVPSCVCVCACTHTGCPPTPNY